MTERDIQGRDGGSEDSTGSDGDPPTPVGDELDRARLGDDRPAGDDPRPTGLECSSGAARPRSGSAADHAPGIESGGGWEPSAVTVRRPRPTRSVHDGVVVAGSGGFGMHLPGTAALVWYLLETPASVDDLAAELGELYPDVDRAEVVDAIVVVLTSLDGQGLLDDGRDPSGSVGTRPPAPDDENAGATDGSVPAGAALVADDSSTTPNHADPDATVEAADTAAPDPAPGGLGGAIFASGAASPCNDRASSTRHPSEADRTRAAGGGGLPRWDRLLLGQLLRDLDPGSGEPPAPIELDAAQWSALRSHAERERVVPLLVDAVTSGALVVRDEDRATLLEREVAIAGTQVFVETRLVEVAALFTDADIGLTVLKGVAVASLDYPDPRLRQFGDVDVLVRRADLERALSVLDAHGWSPASALPRGHLEFTHAFPMRAAAGGDVDVHQALGRRSLGVRIPADELIARSRVWTLHGTALRALDPADRLLHAVVHGGASRGTFKRLSSAADVLVLTRSPAVDPAVVADRAAQWRIAELVRRVIGDVHAQADVDVPARWRDALADRGRGRDALFERAYLADVRRPVLEELVLLRDLSWPRRWRYLTGYLRTDEAYARRHGRSGVRDQLRYVGRKLRRR